MKRPDPDLKENEMHFIYALIDPRTKHVFHVGCARDLKKCLASLPETVATRVAEIAPDIPQMVILQSEEVRPLGDWVKWSKRFRRDLLTNDWRLHRSIADDFTNSVRLRRALGQTVPSDVAIQQDFHEGDSQTPEIFDDILRIAHQKRAKGHTLYGMHGIVTEIRSKAPDTKHPDGFRVPNAHCAFYARKAQMVDLSLLGFFAVSESVADDLVLADGLSWREFAKEHADAIRYSNSPDIEEEDDEWTY